MSNNEGVLEHPVWEQCPAILQKDDAYSYLCKTIHYGDGYLISDIKGQFQ